MHKLIIHTFILAIAFAMGCSVCLAEINTLRVTMVDGSTTDFYFSDQPEVSLSETTMTVTTALGQVELPIENVKTFTYVEVEGAGISNPLKTSGITIFEDHILVNANTSDTIVTVTNMAGLILVSQNVKTGDSAVVDLTGYETGVYIVTVNGESFKILVK